MCEEFILDIGKKLVNMVCRQRHLWWKRREAEKSLGGGSAGGVCVCVCVVYLCESECVWVRIGRGLHK